MHDVNGGWWSVVGGWKSEPEGLGLEGQRSKVGDWWMNGRICRNVCKWLIMSIVLDKKTVKMA